MTQLQNAFSPLLPILDDPDNIPLTNSTALGDPVAPLGSRQCIPQQRSQWQEQITDSHYPATTSQQLLTNRSRTYLITTWYFLLSTSIMDENAGRCAATTVTATLSTNQGPMDTATGTARTAHKTIPLAGRVINVGSDRDLQGISLRQLHITDN